MDENHKSFLNRLLCQVVFLGGCTALGLLLLASVGGCADPVSTRRINLRLNSQADLAVDIHRSEVRHAKRIVEAVDTLDKWWRSDSDRFVRRLPTIGDYVW